MPLGLHTASLNFDIKKEIGQEGKNSTVYLAHDKQLDGKIVVKRIEKADFPLGDDYYSESKLLYSSSHHNVVKVNYGCEDDDCIYIAMPFYKNGSLKRKIDEKSLTVREIIRYALQFLSGLHHIHSKGLMHFDVKPDNILISDSDEALLSDFGLSKAMNKIGLSEPGKVYGNQIPPEVFSASEFSIQYDIYLAGLTLYRMCNGNEDFYAQRDSYDDDNEYAEAIINGKFPDRGRYLHHIPKRMMDAINTALNPDPDQRYTTVLGLINAIAEVDKCLDWRFDSAASHYYMDLGDKEIFVNIAENGNDTKLDSFKHMKDSGRKYAITDGCFEVETRKSNRPIRKLLSELS